MVSRELAVGAVSDREAAVAVEGSPTLAEPPTQVGGRRFDGARRPVSLSTALAILIVRAYQVSIRPLLIGSCKFCPSCSEFAITALQRYGLLRGGWLAARRLLRCHPFGQGGIDPVP